MKPADKTKTVNRILFGFFPFKFKDAAHQAYRYLIGAPNPYARCLADEVYQDCIELGISYDLWSNEKLNSFLNSNSLWSAEEEMKLQGLIEAIEELKVRMYSYAFNKIEREKAREVLKMAKKDVESLYVKKHAYDYLSIEGYAEAERNKFLLAMSIYKDIDKPLIHYTKYLKAPVSLIEQAIETFSKAVLNEEQIRLVSRNEPWRQMWSNKKEGSCIFGKPIIQWTEDQRNTVLWSVIYDSIFENSDCPPDNVIEDDDMLDGWMILQRRERQKNSQQKRADSFISNPNIGNKGEIFIPVNSTEDLTTVTSLNDVGNNARRKQRFKFVQGKGVVPEAQMPDTKMDLRRDMNAKFKERIKGG